MANGLTLGSLGETAAVVLENVAVSMVYFLPQLLAAFLVLILGLILGNWLKTLIKHFFRALKFEKITRNTGIERFLNRAEIRLKVEEIVGETARLLVGYIFLMAALNVVGLETVAQFLNTILGYFPRLISALLIFLVGVVIAGLVESVIKGAIISFDMITARLVGKIASYTVMIFGALVAIGELGIAKEFINILFIGFIAMLALALGLAFGLGAKDMVREILEQWYRSVKKGK